MEIQPPQSRIVATLVVLATFVFLSTAATATSLPVGFTESTIPSPRVDGSWDAVVGITFSQSGRMFAWERGGKVWIVDQAQPVTQPFIDISEEVLGWRDHGLLGYTPDPNFDFNGYVYLLYTVDRNHLMNCDSPVDGVPICNGSEQPPYTAADTWEPNQQFLDPPANARPNPGFHKATIGRLIRLQAIKPAGESDYRHATAVDYSTRKVLLGETWWNQPKSGGVMLTHESHGIATVTFGGDGTLIVSTGDNASYSSADAGSASETYYSSALTDGIMQPKENVGSFRSQMIDSLTGKILRLDPATGDGVPSNPFYDGASPRSAKSRVWALGLRNPFRIHHEVGTGVRTSPENDPPDGDPGTFYIGDVGWQTWEDWHILHSARQNFGWPVYEGMNIELQYAAKDTENQDAPNPLAGGSCPNNFLFEDLIKQETTGLPSFPNPCDTSVQIPAGMVFEHSRPILEWQHFSAATHWGSFDPSGDAVIVDVGVTYDGRTVLGTQFPGNSSTGGVIYDGIDFPAPYQNTYFHGDYGGQWIRNFVVDASDNVLEVRDFASDAGGVVALATHPQMGSLYYVSWASFVRKISYASGGDTTPPTDPTNLTAAAINASQIDLAWTASTDNVAVVGYNVYRSGNPIPIGTAAGTTYSDPGRSANTLYSYQVSAIDAVGNESSFSNVASATTLPDTPENITIVSPLEGALLSGPDVPVDYAFTVTGDPATYHVHANVDGVPFAEEGGLDGTVLLAGLTGGPHAIDLELQDNSHQSVASDSVNITIDATPPTDPTSLTATAISSSQIDLVWTASTDNVAVVGYDIFRDGDPTPIGTAAGTSYSDTGRTANTLYAYQVSAKDEAGNASGLSNVAAASTPEAPVVTIVDNLDLNTSQTGDWFSSSGPNPYLGNSVYCHIACTFTWQSALSISGTYEVYAYWTHHVNRSSIVPYRIDRDGGTDTVVVNQNDPALGGQWNLLGTYNLTAGVNGNVWVSSENGQTSADAVRYVLISGGVPDTTPPTDPTSLTATAINSSQISLAWTASTDDVVVAGYNVYRLGDWRSIQDTVFTPLCAGCHSGPSPPAGLALDEANSYAMLVNAPSTEVPALLRVEPGNPDNSYLIQKLQGTATVGNIMPPGGGLNQATIDLVRQWISDSAPSGLVGTATTSSYPVTGLAPNTAYSFEVTAFDLAGNKSGYSNVATAATPEAPVETIVDNLNVNTSQTGTWFTSSGANPYQGNSVYCHIACTFTWQPNLGSGTYTVYAYWTWRPGRSTTVPYRVDHDGGTATVVVDQQEQALAGQWNLLGLYNFTAGVNGNVWVSSENGQASADAVRWVLMPPDGTPPTDPTGLTATANGATEIDLAWTASTDNVAVAGYYVYQDGDYTLPVATVTTGTSHTVTGLAPITAYSFEVAAFDPSGNASGLSNVAVATTPEAPIETIVDNLDLNTSQTGDWFSSSGPNPYLGNSVYCHIACTFTWQPALSISGTYEVYAYWTHHVNRSSIVPYRIDRDGGTDTVVVNQNDPALGGQWNLLGTYNLTAGVNGNVWVSSENGQTSADAVRYVLITPADTTPPTDPTNLTAMAISPSQIDLTWTASTDNVAVVGYNVYRDGGPTPIDTAAGTSYSDTGRSANTLYSYQVSAIDGAGLESGLSNVASATTLPIGFTLVPDVLNLPQAAAESAITAAGFVVGTVTSQSSQTVPVGSVISQSPSGGASVATGSAVDLVVSSNMAPVLGAIGNQAMAEGDTLTLNLSATDGDAGDTLSFGVAPGMPYGIFTDNGDRTATWVLTPGPGDAGVSTVTVTVTDNGTPVASDQETFTLTVIDPSSPSVSGFVKDSATLDPIANALVTWQTTTTQTATALDGSFWFNVTGGTGLKIVGAKKGYYNESVTTNSPATNVEILLAPVTIGTNESYSFVDPNTCDICHPNQKTEWDNSAMAEAGINTWVHDIYNGNGTLGGMGGFVYTRDSVYRGTNPNSECAACHQPETWVAGPAGPPAEPFSGPLEGPDDVGYPSTAAGHGISCDSCHKIADVDTQKINAPGIFPDAVTINRPFPGIQVQYGLNSDSDYNAPGTMEPSYQPQLAAEVCGVCHQDKNDINEDHTFAGVTSEPTYIEWLQSPYGDPGSASYQSCIDCHMPPSGETQICAFEPLVRDPGTVRTHAIEGTTAAYLDNAVELSLQTQVVGSELQVDVTIDNNLTGHHVPTGVTVRNMILLVEAWEDGQDPLVNPLVHTGTETVHDLGGIGDPALGYYAGLPGKFYAKVNHDASGQGPTFFTDATGILFDNRIPALGTDATNYTFTVPAGSGIIHVRARLIYRRAFRFLVDAKSWTLDGHGNPLEDVAGPDYGHLMELATEDVPY